MNTAHDLDLDDDRFLTTMYAADLRREWRRRPAASLAVLNGVKTQLLDQARVVFSTRAGPRVMVWRKRGSLQWVQSQVVMSANAMTRLDASPLESWEQLQALVEGIYPEPEYPARV